MRDQATAAAAAAAVAARLLELKEAAVILRAHFLVLEDVAAPPAAVVQALKESGLAARRVARSAAELAEAVEAVAQQVTGRTLAPTVEPFPADIAAVLESTVCRPPRK